MVLGLGLCSCLLAACSGAPAPSPTATATVPVPTATAAPSLTATATYTPMSTRTPTPVAVSEDGEVTPTWTPVPGNPIWSFWTYENVEFRLPVAWRKGPGSPAGGSLYDGPDGDGRPQLSISVGEAAAGIDSAGLAQERVAALKSTLAGFSLGKAETASLSGLPAQRVAYRYKAPAAASGGSDRTMRGVAWYAIREGVSFAFEFSVDDRQYGVQEKVFDDIAARVNILP